MRLVPEWLSETAIWRRWQKMVGEFAKFGTVGVVNTVVNYAVFNALLLTIFVQSPLKANVVATIVATTASYFMNRHWTYRDRPKSTLRREYVLFFFFNLAGLTIELSVLALAKYGLALTGVLAVNIAKTVGMVLATIFRFWAYRTFVFPVGLTGHPDPSVVVPAQSGAAQSEFDELTAPLEIEFAGDLDPRLDAELDAELGSEAARHRR